MEFHVAGTVCWVRLCVYLFIYFCMSNDAKTHTLAWIFHLRREARPPSAFLTCDHVQICTGRQGEGELVWVFYHFFISFSFFYPDYRPSQDAPDPNLLLKFHPKKKQKNRFPGRPFGRLAPGCLRLPTNKYRKYQFKECREESSLTESLRGNW